jgi:hypothetical protein
LNAKFKNAAARAKATATEKIAEDPASDPTSATIANPKPTPCANLGGLTSSRIGCDFSRGLTTVRKRIA